MIAYVVTEGPFDVELLRRILPQELLEGVEFVVAGGTSAVKSMARSLLVRRQTPVAIVIDADTTSPELVQERRQSIEEVVESVAGNVLFKVILAIPDLETIISPGEQSMTSPSNQNSMQSLNALTPSAVENLQQTPPILELKTFLRQAQELATLGENTAESV